MGIPSQHPSFPTPGMTPEGSEYSQPGGVEAILGRPDDHERYHGELQVEASMTADLIQMRVAAANGSALDPNRLTPIPVEHETPDYDILGEAA